MRLEEVIQKGKQRYVRAMGQRCKRPTSCSATGTVLPLAEGEEVRLVGNATDTPSDYDTLIRCWDVDPGLDSNDIGGADDDCDVVGDELVWHWNTSGTHTVIYHVTDDDGVRVVRFFPLKSSTSHRLFEPRTLSATPSKHVYWMQLKRLTPSTISTKSRSFGISTHPLTAMVMVSGTTMLIKSVNRSSMFTREGSYTIRVIAWDENPERPGTRVINVEIGAQNVPLWRNWGLLSSAMKPIPLLSHCLPSCFFSRHDDPTSTFRQTATSHGSTRPAAERNFQR